jgi:hypothetical protein
MVSRRSKDTDNRSNRNNPTGSRRRDTVSNRLTEARRSNSTGSNRTRDTRLRLCLRPWLKPTLMSAA